MEPTGATEFLRRQKTANVGTVDANGWPYVAPLVYIYTAVICCLYTADHPGHSLTNVQHNPRICIEVSEIGELRRGKPHACNSVLYTQAWLHSALPGIACKEAVVSGSSIGQIRQAKVTFKLGYP